MLRKGNGALGGPAWALAQALANADAKALADADLLIDSWLEMKAPASLVTERALSNLFAMASSKGRSRLVLGLARAARWSLVRELVPANSPEAAFLLPLADCLKQFYGLQLFAGRRALHRFISAAPSDLDEIALQIAIDFADDAAIMAVAAHAPARPDGWPAASRRSGVAAPLADALGLAQDDAQALADPVPVALAVDTLALLPALGRDPDLARILLRMFRELHAVEQPGHRRLLAALAVELVDRGQPIDPGVGALIAGHMAEVGHQRRGFEVLDRATYAVADELGTYGFFLLRRACAMAPSQADRRRLAGRFADALCDGIHTSGNRAYFRHVADDAPGFDLEPEARGRAAAFVAAADPQHVTFRRRRRSKTRIAVLMSGQLRSFATTSPQIHAQIVEPLGADVFVATWDTTGFSAGFHGDARRILTPAISELLSPELRDLSAFLNRFPEVATEMRNASAPSSEVLKRSNLSAACAILNEARTEDLFKQAFPSNLTADRKTINQLKMFFGLRIGADLIARAEEKFGPYDIIVRIRPDIEIAHFIHTDVLGSNRQDDLIYVSGVHPHGVTDGFAYGAASALRRYLHLFDFIHAAMGFDGVPGGQNIYGEAFVFDCLSAQGLRFENIDTLDAKLSSAVLSTAEAAQLMLRRLAEEEPLQKRLTSLLGNETQRGGRLRPAAR